MIGQEEIDLVEGLIYWFSEKPIIFDCGANKGHWSDIFYKQFGDNFQLHSFEPSKKLLSYLEIKYEYKQNITFNQIAVSNKNGLANFFYFDNFNNELSSLHKNDCYADMPMKIGIVKTITIDSYCEQKGIEYIDYLKFDIEGNEYNALLGCENMIKKGAIKFIQVEYGGHYQTSNTKFADIIKIANDNDYQVYSFKENNYNEVKSESFIEDYHYENYIITKEKIHTWSYDGWNKEFIKSVEDLPKINFYLEIGAFEGFATKWVCDNLLQPNGRCICIDPMQDFYTEEDRTHPYFDGQYQRFLRTTKGLPVELRRVKSQLELPKMHAFRFDLIYIDGRHDYEGVYLDAFHSFPIVKVGGYICFDDWCGYSEETTKGIQRFLDEFNGRYEIVKDAYQLLIKRTS